MNAQPTSLPVVAKKKTPMALLIFIAMILGIVVGYMIFTNFPDKKAATEIAGYISMHVGHLPAADQDADRAAGVLDAGRRHRTHGRRIVGGARVRASSIGLVRDRVARSRWFSASSLANLFQPGENLGLPLPDIGAVRQPRDVEVHGQGLRQPPRAEVVRRGDGQQRDPADRRVLDVLRRRSWPRWARRRSA